MTSKEPLPPSPGIWGRPFSAAGQKVPSDQRAWGGMARPGMQPRGTLAELLQPLLGLRLQSQEGGRNEPSLGAHSTEEETEAWGGWATCLVTISM